MLTIGTIILTYNWLFSSFYSFDSSPFLFREESKEKRRKGEKEKRTKGETEKSRKGKKQIKLKLMRDAS